MVHGYPWVMKWEILFILVFGYLSCNGLGDTKLPVVTITHPKDGAILSGVVEIEAAATDNDTVLVVKFFVDESFIGEDSTSLYECTWDTGQCEPESEHSIMAQAWDGAENDAEDLIRVTIRGPALLANLPLSSD
jgi:hypothetical protein